MRSGFGRKILAKRRADLERSRADGELTTVSIVTNQAADDGRVRAGLQEEAGCADLEARIDFVSRVELEVFDGALTHYR